MISPSTWSTSEPSKARLSTGPIGHDLRAGAGGETRCGASCSSHRAHQGPASLPLPLRRPRRRGARRRRRVHGRDLQRPVGRHGRVERCSPAGRTPRCRRTARRRAARWPRCSRATRRPPRRTPAGRSAPPPTRPSPAPRSTARSAWPGPATATWRAGSRPPRPTTRCSRTAPARPAASRRSRAARSRGARRAPTSTASRSTSSACRPVRSSAAARRRPCGSRARTSR